MVHDCPMHAGERAVMNIRCRYCLLLADPSMHTQSSPVSFNAHVRPPYLCALHCRMPQGHFRPQCALEAMAQARAPTGGGGHTR